MKKTLTLDGPANRLLEALCAYFPKLKVVARGNELLLEGAQDDIIGFNEKISMLIEKRMHKRSLSAYDVEELFEGGNAAEEFIMHSDAPIVFGNDGKPIKARNVTQEKMVKAYFENDLIFAVGPAGTGKTYVAIALAVRALKNREVKRIILTRPAVEAARLHARTHPRSCLRDSRRSPEHQSRTAEDVPHPNGP